MGKINPYMSAGWFTVVFDHWKIRVITKEKFDIWDWTIMLPKSLIQFILSNDLASPLKISVLLLDEEVGWIIDAVGFSPDEKAGFLTCKNLYYISK